jgi:hypothetical protein
MTAVPPGVTRGMRVMLTRVVLDVMTMHTVTRFCIGSGGAQYQRYNGNCGDKQSHWNSG